MQHGAAPQNLVIGTPGHSSPSFPFCILHVAGKVCLCLGPGLGTPRKRRPRLLSRAVAEKPSADVCGWGGVRRGSYSIRKPKAGGDGYSG